MSLSSVQRPLHEILTSDDAFYKQPDYQQKREAEFNSSSALSEIAYRFNTEVESNLIFAIKIIAAIIFPLIAIVWAIYAITCIAIVPAAVMSPQNRHFLANLPGAITKRITIEVNGKKIDAMIMGTEESFKSKRWILKSNGNGEFYDHLWHHSCAPGLKRLAVELNSSILVYNYPGAGASEGFPSPSAVVNSYKAMLTMLEDKVNGIGAKEIITFGHSLGGGVQGEVLNTHVPKADIKYVHIKTFTFSTLSDEITHLLSRVAAWMAKMFGWTLSSVESSVNLTHPEIVIQTVDSQKLDANNEVTDASHIIDDGVIGEEATLMKALLARRAEWKGRKHLIGAHEEHNGEAVQNPHTPFDWSKIATLVQDCLANQ